MADSSQALRTGLQVILALVIVGLAYWLYLSITEPYKVIEQERELTDRTRQRMVDVRSALIAHEQQIGRFPGSLDSLVFFVRDSLSEGGRDSLLQGRASADSLILSPRTGRQFVYSVNDTSNINIYLLEDPDTDDRIGSERPEITRLNAASWE